MTSLSANAQEPVDAEVSVSPHPWEEVQDNINIAFGRVVNFIAPVLFFEVGMGAAQKTVGDKQIDQPRAIPLIILILVTGGVFFTFFLGWVNIRLLKHAVSVVRGKFDNPDDEGEISHFRALTSALSATVGLGNIAGVAVAISLGGAGAVFWMWLTAVFGMSLKFTSCTMAQLYRRIKPDGSVLGGPMVYLDDGIREQAPGLAPLGRLLAIVFSFFCIMGAIGGGNLFQANQTYKIIEEQYIQATGSTDSPAMLAWIVGIVLAGLAGIVIIGGIKRIGEVTSRMVPLMCGFYCLVCLVLIFSNFTAVPKLIWGIFTEAFNAKAVYGGFLGVLIQGMKRAAFSNEAGLGSAAIAHAAAKTKEPVREGIVAMLGPFIDTIIVCTMTALAILITQSHTQDGLGGVELTRHAFSQMPGFLGNISPWFLCLAVFIFAFSTIISWCYYGERSAEYLLGESGILPFRVFYCIIIILGPLVSLSSVVDFADMMMLSMVFPNIIGLLILSPLIRSHVRGYIGRLKSGDIKPVGPPG